MNVLGILPQRTSQFALKRDNQFETILSDCSSGCGTNCNIVSKQRMSNASTLPWSLKSCLSNLFNSYKMLLEISLVDQ